MTNGTYRAGGYGIVLCPDHILDGYDFSLQFDIAVDVCKKGAPPNKVAILCEGDQPRILPRYAMLA